MKSSRFGVGSLICVQVTDDLRTVSGDLRLFLSWCFRISVWYMKKETQENTQVYVEELRLGKESGLMYFFNRYQKALCYYANKIIQNENHAVEIVEDSFVLLWENRGGFEHHRAIVAYLYTCTKNSALQMLRKAKRQKLSDRELIYMYDDTEKNVQDLIVETETIRQVMEAIEKLPVQCRRIFIMHYIEGKNYHTIASELRLSISTIRNQKARAIQIIRKIISAIGFVLIISSD